jgi:hypothetical protein
MPCPSVLPFSLPSYDVQTNWAPILAYENGAQDVGPSDAMEGGNGLSFVDVNGDQLVDVVWSFESDNGGDALLWQCIYLNNQCGWGK